MGTRADFYVGKGKDAEWIGSVAWDGYQWGERLKKDDHNDITKSKSEEEYRQAVSKMLLSCDDGTTTDMGWPWPWKDSCTTDCAYCFVNGNLEAFIWGRPWDTDENELEDDWPQMGDEHSAKAGTERSGIIILVS